MCCILSWRAAESPGSIEENIDVENFARMPLVSDFLNVLGTTWGRWSLSTKFAFKKLTSKKQPSEISSVQSAPAELQRDPKSRVAVKNVAQPVTKPIRRRSVQDRKPVTHSLSDVASHDKPGDSWIVIKKKVWIRRRQALKHNFGTFMRV